MKIRIPGMKAGMSVMAVVVLIAIGFIYGLAGITDVNPGEIALKIKMLGSNRGMQKDVLTTGTRWLDPIIYDVYVYNYQKRQYGGESLTDMPSQTSDGQPVLVDISLEIGLKPDMIPYLHTEVGKTWYASIVYPALRSAVRDLVPTVSSDVIYTAKGRANVGAQITEFLQSKGIPYGIIIDVNLRAIDFTNQAFVAKLEDKAIAQQNIEIENRNAKSAEKTAVKIANLAEGEKQKRIKQAEAKKEEQKLDGEGRQLLKEADAKGILAIATAEAEGVRLRREALSGPGSEHVVAIEWARNIGPSIKVYGFPTGATGTTSLMDLNGVMQGAFKGMSVPK